MAMRIYRSSVANFSPMPFVGVYVSPDSAVGIPMQNELFGHTQILTEIFNSKFLSNSNVEQIYLVSSLQKSPSKFVAHEAIRLSGISPARIVEFGTNCASILDAFAFFSSTNEKEGISVISCSDMFGTNFASARSYVDWKDGRAAFVFDSKFESTIAILSYIVGTDSNYASMCDFKNKNNQLLEIHRNEDFEKNDIENEIFICNEALAQANVQWNEIDGYVTINRSNNRARELRNRLKFVDISIYESRFEFGHRGGSDLLNNLKYAINNTNFNGPKKFILVGNGLGYSWSAMVVEVIYEKSHERN